MLFVIAFKLIPIVKLSILTESPKRRYPSVFRVKSSFVLDIINSKPTYNKMINAMMSILIKFIFVR